MLYLFFEQYTDLEYIFNELINYNTSEFIFHSIKYNTVLPNCIIIKTTMYSLNEIKKYLIEILNEIDYEKKFQLLKLRSYEQELV